MALRSLLVCRDPETLRIMRKVLSDGEMEVEVCTGPEAAIEALSRKKFDAVLVDCDDLHSGTDVLRNVRKAPSNRSAIVFAIINGITTVRAAFDMGANFVLDKPLTMDRVSRSMKAAHGLIVRERRRYFRQPVNLPVTVALANGEHVEARVSNLSEGGMSVLLPGKSADSGAVRVRFQLPGTAPAVEAKGEIAWADQAGCRVGVRFLHVAQDTHRRLEEWLGLHIEKHQPVGLFLNASRRGMKVGS